ncbi:MAG: hypothetical protein ACXVF0_01145 [Blastococcus sp.]
MPSTSIRPHRLRPAGAQQRPLVVPFTAALGFLLTAEVLFLGFQLWVPDPSVNGFLVVPLLLAGLAALGAVLVLRGVRGGWAVLAGAAVLPLLALLALVFVLGSFGAGAQAWGAVALALGPLVTLVLVLQRPTREWCRAGGANRSQGGRRRPPSAR